jgi:hypothetical protein
MVHATRILVDNISGTGPFMSVQLSKWSHFDLEEYKDDEEREREEKKHHLYQLKQQLEQYLQELPVVGFNTGKYDVNTMKVDFFNL